MRIYLYLTHWMTRRTRMARCNVGCSEEKHDHKLGVDTEVGLEEYIKTVHCS